MSMYERFANDCSDELFHSIYSDLYGMAMKDNRERYESEKRKRDYMPGEHQYVLNDFCAGRASVGEVLDYIKTYKGV